MITERGVVVWVTAASTAAAHETAVLLAEALAARELRVELLHGERPGFESITEPAGLAAVAGLLAGHGIHSVVAEAVSSRAARDAARRSLGSMIEVFVQSGAAASPTWEAPPQAEAEVDGSAAVASIPRVLRTLEVLGYLKPRDDLAYSPDEEREVIKRLKAFGYM
jgi:adenylylsulfate kinase-like enzyme